MIIRCDSAAMVSKTSELLPEPDTPVNTVSLRFGSSTLTSLRLFTRAPVTRIRSWVSATCGVTDSAAVAVLIMGSSGVGRLSADVRSASSAQRTSKMRIMLPAGSRKAQSRTPHGWSVGSCTTSASVACSLPNVASTSGVARLMPA